MSDKNIVFLFYIRDKWLKCILFPSFIHLPTYVWIYTFIFVFRVCFLSKRTSHFCYFCLLTHSLANLLLVHTFICDYHVQSGNKNNMKRIEKDRKRRRNISFCSLLCRSETIATRCSLTRLLDMQLRKVTLYTIEYI